MSEKNSQKSSEDNKPFSSVVIIIMGVAGSGKTAIGKLLSERLDFQFVDADDFHSLASIEKMQSGEPLTDEDRAPWLARLSKLIDERVNNDSRTILACSALKQSYRNILQQHQTKSDLIQFVYLKGTYELLLNRLRSRTGHYMKADMLKSQLETLEEPSEAITIDASLTVDQVVEQLIASLKN